MEADIESTRLPSPCPAALISPFELGDSPSPSPGLPPDPERRTTPEIPAIAQLATPPPPQPEIDREGEWRNPDLGPPPPPPRWATQAAASLEVPGLLTATGGVHSHGVMPAVAESAEESLRREGARLGLAEGEVGLLARAIFRLGDTFEEDGKLSPAELSLNLLRTKYSDCGRFLVERLREMDRSGDGRVDQVRTCCSD